MLAVAGGAIGNSRHLAITRTHHQPPLLYAAIVGGPGTTKSPALSLVRRPLDRAQERYRAEWRKEMDAWRQSEKEDRGPRPMMRRCVCSDTTTESLGLLLNENPRGLALLRDEVSGLVAGMNQYKAGGRGHDRQVFLDLWAQAPLCVDRKSDQTGEPLYVHLPFACICGCIQPGILDRLRGDERTGRPLEDGFIDRWLFSYPVAPEARGESWEEVHQDTEVAWQDVVDKLLTWTMTRENDGPERPFYLKLTECGRQAWEDFTKDHAAEVNSGEFPGLSSRPLEQVARVLWPAGPDSPMLTSGLWGSFGMSMSSPVRKSEQPPGWFTTSRAMPARCMPSWMPIRGRPGRGGSWAWCPKQG